MVSKSQRYWEAMCYAYGREDGNPRRSLRPHDFADEAYIQEITWGRFATLYEQMLATSKQTRMADINEAHELALKMNPRGVIEIEIVGPNV